MSAVVASTQIYSEPGQPRRKTNADYTDNYRVVPNGQRTGPMDDVSRERIKYEILCCLADGLSRTDSCTCAGIGYQTFTLWTERDEAWAIEVRRAEVQHKRHHLAKINHANKEVPWQASAWMLERKNWQEFGAKAVDINEEARTIRVRRVVAAPVETLPPHPGNEPVPEQLPNGSEPPTKESPSIAEVVVDANAETTRGEIVVAPSASTPFVPLGSLAKAVVDGRAAK